MNDGVSSVWSQSKDGCLSDDDGDQGSWGLMKLSRPSHFLKDVTFEKDYVEVTSISLKIKKLRPFKGFMLASRM